MRWFGTPWPLVDARAPICENDAERMETPVGEVCLYCEEPIGADDRGTEMPYIHDDVSEIRFIHIECSFRQVMGGPAHLGGACSCEGGTEDPDMGLSRREAARWVWATFNSTMYPPMRTEEQG